MSKDSKYTSRYDLDDMVRGGKPKRAGDKDRDAITAHLREAFAAGYLKEPELQERIDKAVQAVTMTDLRNLTEDLPGNAELNGKEKVPSRVRKLLVGIEENWDEYPWVYGVTLALSLMIAIAPSVGLAQAHLANNPLGAVVMVITIITGVVGFFCSLIALIASTD